MSWDYDVAVLGGGPGGYGAALHAARQGAKVALVEREHLGGVCLNRGCVPTKALLASAHLYARLRQAARWGLRVEGLGFDWEAIQQRKARIVQQYRRGLQTLMETCGVEVFSGTGRLAGPQSVEVAGRKTERFRARSIILATGSRPLRPPWAIEDERVMTSDEALELPSVPQRAVVVGAGPVGLEFADLWACLGARVTVVEMLPRILPQEDGEMAAALQRVLSLKGVRFRTGARVSRLEATSAGILVCGQQGEGEFMEEAEAVLLAIGRVPNVEGLGLETVGLETQGKGVAVDGGMSTCVPFLFAVGDVVHGAGLAHLASAEGVVAAENALGRPSTMEGRVVPRCVYTEPGFAAVGLTEEEVQAQGKPYLRGEFPFRLNAMALAEEQREGFVKALVEQDTGRLLGLHILGPDAPNLIAEATFALQAQWPALGVAHIIHAHPTLPEVLAEALLDAYGASLHKPSS